ncbi:MAG: hypothetical protein NVS3B2_15490 [Ramlibacter sp.]
MAMHDSFVHCGFIADGRSGCGLMLGLLRGRRYRCDGGNLRGSRRSLRSGGMRIR